MSIGSAIQSAIQGAVEGAKATIAKEAKEDIKKLSDGDIKAIPSLMKKYGLSYEAIRGLFSQGYSLPKLMEFLNRGINGSAAIGEGLTNFAAVQQLKSEPPMSLALPSTTTPPPSTKSTTTPPTTTTLPPQINPYATPGSPYSSSPQAYGNSCKDGKCGAGGGTPMNTSNPGSWPGTTPYSNTQGAYGKDPIQGSKKTASYDRPGIDPNSDLGKTFNAASKAFGGDLPISLKATADWCNPCRQEYADLKLNDKASKSLGDGLMAYNMGKYVLVTGNMDINKAKQTVNQTASQLGTGPVETYPTKLALSRGENGRWQMHSQEAGYQNPQQFDAQMAPAITAHQTEKSITATEKPEASHDAHPGPYINPNGVREQKPDPRASQT